MSPSRACAARSAQLRTQVPGRAGPNCGIPARPKTPTRLPPRTARCAGVVVRRTHSLVCPRTIKLGRASASCTKHQRPAGSGAQAERQPAGCLALCHWADPAPGRREGQPHHRRVSHKGSRAAAARREDGLGLLGRRYSKRGLGREPGLPPQSLEVAVSLKGCVVAGWAVEAREAASLSRETSQPDEGRACVIINTTPATTQKKTEDAARREARTPLRS